MANFLAWSHSRLKSFLECPYQLYMNSVAPRDERIPYVQNIYQKAGEDVDNALTARIGQGTPLPPQYAQHEPIAAVLASAPGHKFTQMDLALTQAFEPCGSKDWDNCWVRIKIDFAVIDGRWAYFVDYKNGKIDVDEKQLKLYSIAGFHTFAEVETVDTSYAWLAHGKTTDRTYHRRDLEELWMEFIPDVERMQVAYQTKHWPATPEKKTAWGGSVCSYCNVNRAGKCKDAKVLYAGR